MSWQRVRAEFDALVGMPAAARDARLRELTATDAWLAEQLRSLFAEDAAAGAFLERVPAPGTVAASLQPALAMGRRFGRFELVKPLGSGGMASVWEARQTEPSRRVAIKLVARGERSDAERWRFEHEVDVLAALNHPAIATFFEAGSDAVDGTEVAWFAMELVEGAADVLTWVRTRAIGREQRLQLFLRLCDAVEYGHRRGVLHRDLKPSNVLVGSDGQLKLIDFGIAKALAGAGAADAGAMHTQTSHVVGTLQYMAPEQLAGRTDAIGTASDVYALGSILYQLLCDRAPYSFEGVPVVRIASVVLDSEPMPPSRARPDLPAELGWIVLRALEKDPARRYPTVAALVDDVERFRQHLPVKAGPPSAAYRLRKFVRRHRVGVAIALALAIGVGSGAWGLVQGIEQAKAGEISALRGRDLALETMRVMNGMFDAIDDTTASRDVKVHQVLDGAKFDERVSASPVLESAVRELRGTIYMRLHRYTEARRELERAHELRARMPVDEWSDAEIDRWQRRHAIHDAMLGRARVASGNPDSGWQLVRDAVAATAAETDYEIRRRVLETFCAVLCETNQFAELERSVVVLADLAHAASDAKTAQQCDQWRAVAAAGLERRGAVAAAERSLASAREQFGDDHVRTCEAMSALVVALQEAGDLEAAAKLYPELVDSARELFGAGHENTLTVLNNRADLLRRRGDSDGALAALRDIVAVYEQRSVDPTTMHMIALANLGQALFQRQHFDEGEPLLRRASDATRTLCDAQDPNGPSIRFNHAACLAAMKRWREAEPMLLAEYETLQKMLPPGHSVFGKLRRTIADSYKVNGDPQRAAEWHAK